MLMEAVEASGGLRPYTRLQQAVADLLDPDANERESLLEVQRAFIGYAAFLARDERFCDALDQIAVAEQLDENQRPLAARAEYEALCVPTPEPGALPPLAGRILFSAQAGDQYGVYDLGVDGMSAPRPIIDDASQPSLGPDGVTLAFYDRGPNVQGLTKTRLQRRAGRRRRTRPPHELRGGCA